VKCSDCFGAKRRGLLKVEIVLAPKGVIQNLIKNIRCDIRTSFLLISAKSIFFNIFAVIKPVSAITPWPFFFFSVQENLIKSLS
jgi:hypothetical protein